MCGIAGGIYIENTNGIEEKLKAALESMQHRGPNDEGKLIEYNNNSIVALGHRRLSIIDLSSNGHQPMESSCGRFSIIFNGEIYNYKELREELIELGCEFHTNTDTEVLLRALIIWEESCLPKLLGMFAFVFYDREKQKILCARDAFGVKPIFYISNEKYFLFASEQSALLKLSGEKPRLDWQRSYDYLTYGDYDSQERTFFEGVQQLLPAHFVKIEINTLKISGPNKWWSPSLKENKTISFDEAANKLRELFLKNISLHMQSDVPLGVALSGGVDSSAVACGMRYLMPKSKIHTFSYIADEKNISEEYWVDKINTYIDGKAHKVRSSTNDLEKDLDDMIGIQGEPFGSTSIYAQYRVFQLAKQSGITVILDGQGADELMAGYIGYPGQRILSLLEEGSFLDAVLFVKNWSNWPKRSAKQALLNLGEITLPGYLYKAARLIAGLDKSRSFLKTGILQDAGITLNKKRMTLLGEAKSRRVMAQLHYSLQNRGLPALLRHADRNSMKYSIESRVPFLTIEMAEFLYSLPENYLISNLGETKSVFRQAMKGIVPSEVLFRKDKIGFETPEKDWIIGNAAIFKKWLVENNDIKFIDQKKLIENFELIVAGKLKYTVHVWRYINFIRWCQLNKLQF